VRVTDARGRIIYEAPQEHRRVLQPDVVDQVNYALTQVIDDSHGTGNTETRAMNQAAGMVAGKTGTMAYEVDKKPTKDSTDAWFVGYNCRLTASVWMGKPDGQFPMGQVEDVQFVNGGTLPARIFSRFMAKAAFVVPPCAEPYKRPKSAEPPTTQPPPTMPNRRDDDEGERDDRTDATKPWWARPWGAPTTTDEPGPTTTTTRKEQRPTTTSRRRGPGGQPAEPPDGVGAATLPGDH
jgi:membrane peptidoglycan carboxypeptidase